MPEIRLTLGKFSTEPSRQYFHCLAPCRGDVFAGFNLLLRKRQQSHVACPRWPSCDGLADTWEHDEGRIHFRDLLGCSPTALPQRHSAESGWWPNIYHLNVNHVTEVWYGLVSLVRVSSKSSFCVGHCWTQSRSDLKRQTKHCLEEPLRRMLLHHWRSLGLHCISQRSWKVQYLTLTMLHVCGNMRKCHTRHRGLPFTSQAGGVFAFFAYNITYIHIKYLLIPIVMSVWTDCPAPCVYAILCNAFS